MAFDRQPHLQDAALDLRPLVEADRDALYAAASDPLIWEQHPARTRWQRPVFDPYFDALLANGGTLAIRDRATGQVIGCSQYYATPDVPGTWSIGFTFLTRAYWGGPTNFAVKRLMLDHAFATEPEIWLHVAPNNWRSRKGTEKLGAVLMYEAKVTLSGGPTLSVCYRITRDDWAKRTQ